MGPVGLHLSVPSPEHTHHASSGSEARTVPRTSPSDRPSLGNPTLVPHASGSPPDDTPTASRRPTTGVIPSTDDILAFDRLGFLSLALSRLELPDATIADLIKAHRASTRRQYESGWKKFQSFVRQRNVSNITPETLASFATFVFHSKAKVSPATVTNAMVAIRDPLAYGFGVEINRRTWDLLRSSFFIQRPPAPPSPPSWSLEKVLAYLQSPRFTVEPSPSDILLKALFLVAMATGHRVSQLAALLRTNQFMRFGHNDSSVTLAPKPRFLAKNERADHRMSPVVVPAWMVSDAHHPLCPVAALRAYISASSSTSAPDLWVDPQSLRCLKTTDLAAKLVQLISAADPQSEPKAHQVRKYASSLAFFRSFDVDQVRRAGQWSSSASFVQRYLLTHLSNTPCVAMGSTPNP